MGDWTIRIAGTGAHHNSAINIEYDANKRAGAFVEQLKNDGHTVHDAVFVHAAGVDFFHPGPDGGVSMVTGVSEIHPDPLLRFFDFSHLPPHLRTVSARFHALAMELCTMTPSAERTVALRKLLEAKDCAVRAAL